MRGAGLLPQDADQTVHVLAMFVREHLKQRQRLNDTDGPSVTGNIRNCRHVCLAVNELEAMRLSVTCTSSVSTAVGKGLVAR